MRLREPALRSARVVQADHACPVGLRLCESEAPVKAGGREHALASAERQRKDVQVQLVHEVVLEQRVHELAAAVGQDRLAGGRLERADGSDDVVADDLLLRCLAWRTNDPWPDRHEARVFLQGAMTQEREPDLSRVTARLGIGAAPRDSPPHAHPPRPLVGQDPRMTRFDIPAAAVLRAREQLVLAHFRPTRITRSSRCATARTP